MHDCTSTPDEKKAVLRKEAAAKWAEASEKRKSQQKQLKSDPTKQSQCEARLVSVESLKPLQALLDSGADAAAVVSDGLINYLQQFTKLDLSLVHLENAVVMQDFGQVDVALTRHVVLPELQLVSDSGTLSLLNVSAWVDDTDKGANITLGRPVMQLLGYDVRDLIKRACDKQSTWDMQSLVVTASPDGTPLQNIFRLWAPPRPVVDDEEEIEGMLPDDETPTESAEDLAHAVKRVLKSKVDEARAYGISDDGAIALEKLLCDAVDIFRVGFVEGDEPVRREPLKVQLKPDAVPVRCTPRRYNPAATQYLRKHIAELERYGLVYRTSTARWACAPRIVPKKNGDMRMTVDVRPVNAVTVPMQWPMPIMEVVLSRLAGQVVFFVCDWFKGFWQLALHKDSQELLTIMAISLMVSSTRAIMGQTDAVAYCQQTAQEVYGEKYGNGLEAWLDDVMGSAKTEQELLELLRFLFDRCREYNLKLNPEKCEFFTRKVTWFGKVISAEGVSHDPSGSAASLNSRRRRRRSSCSSLSAR